MFEIESGIPIPESRSHARSAYPFAAMEVNSSFVVAIGDEEYKRVVSRVRGACGVYSAAHPGVKFTVRTVQENGGIGLRVWRIA